MVCKLAESKPIKDDNNELKNMSFGQSVKFYVSLSMGTITLISILAFIFLVPFVVEPAISTILANYNSTAVVCATSSHYYKEGITNCVWTSCKEGCTVTPTRCHQIYINYSTTSYHQWIQRDGKSKIEWVGTNVKLSVNPNGCGYPPWVNCTRFALEYGDKREDEMFPCYYSMKYPNDLAVATYDGYGTIKNAFLAISVPGTVIVTFSMILTYWYCWPFHYDNYKLIKNDECSRTSSTESWNQRNAPLSTTGKKLNRIHKS